MARRVSVLLSARLIIAHQLEFAVKTFKEVLANLTMTARAPFVTPSIKSVAATILQMVSLASKRFNALRQSATRTQHVARSPREQNARPQTNVVQGCVTLMESAVKLQTVQDVSQRLNAIQDSAILEASVARIRPMDYAQLMQIV